MALDFGQLMSLAGAAQGGQKQQAPDPELERLRQLAKERDAEQMARQTKPYAFEYNAKAQGAGAPPGTQYGVMTEDLKRTPAGQAVVHTDPRTGFEAVDTPRLTMQNTAALGQVTRRLDELDQQKNESRNALNQLRTQKAQQDNLRARSALDQQLERLRRIGA